MSRRAKNRTVRRRQAPSNDVAAMDAPAADQAAHYFNSLGALVAVLAAPLGRS